MTTQSESSPSKVVMTLANKITLGRILLIPLVVILLLQRQMKSALALLALMFLSDLLDGLAARLRKEKTALGAFLDPLADKLLLTSIYMTLTYLGFVEIWVFVVIFSRDLIIILGWSIIYILTGSANIVPRVLGKITTTVQMCAALLFIIGVPSQIRTVLLWAIVSFTITSVIDYVLIGDKNLRK